MLFDRKEYQIRKTLRRLARQRVIEARQDVWIVDNLLGKDDDTMMALNTCLMRGWVEDMPISVQQASPQGNARHFSVRTAPAYRPTDSGWAVINRTYFLNILMAFLTVLTILVALAVA